MSAAETRYEPPGTREKKQLLREMMEAREVAFSVVGDIAKAHQRFKHREEEHGYLGCQIDAKEEIEGDPNSQTVYVNKVGTFGVSWMTWSHLEWPPREGGGYR